MGKFKISARCRIDLDDTILRFARWGLKQGQFAFLSNVEVIDQCAHG